MVDPGRVKIKLVVNRDILDMENQRFPFIFLVLTVETVLSRDQSELEVGIVKIVVARLSLSQPTAGN